MRGRFDDDVRGHRLVRHEEGNMGSETPETIMHTWMRRVWNELDADAIDEMLAPDALIHGLGSEPIEGTTGWREFHRAFTGAFADIRITIEDQVVSGHKVAIRFEATMVHRASEEPVGLRSMAFVDVRDGLIVEGWNLVDFLPALSTLGIIPADAMERALSGPL
jgi:ketosteroid isomerase-like protein